MILKNRKYQIIESMYVKINSNLVELYLNHWKKTSNFLKKTKQNQSYFNFLLYNLFLIDL